MLLLLSLSPLVITLPFYSSSSFLSSHEWSAAVVGVAEFAALFSAVSSFVVRSFLTSYELLVVVDVTDVADVAYVAAMFSALSCLMVRSFLTSHDLLVVDDFADVCAMFILFLCLFLSLWPFQLYFIPRILLTTVRFLTLFFRSYFCLIGPFNYISLYESLPQL